jgi:hypothetical protein
MPAYVTALVRVTNQQEILTYAKHVERTPREVDSTARSRFDLAVTGRGKARLRGAVRFPQAIGALVIGSGLLLFARAAGIA